MRVNKTLVAGGLTALLLVGLLGSWFASGWQAVRREQRALRDAPHAEAAARARELADELDAQLDALAGREDARPWYHYQNLVHDPRGAAAGASVAPSPLADGPDDPLIAAHFQIDAAGMVSLPNLNPEVPSLGSGDLAGNLLLRGALAAEVEMLRADLGAMVAMIGEPRVEVIQQEDYAQTINAQRVYQQTNIGERDPAAEAGTSPVAITVAPFGWRAVTIGGKPALVAVRRVDTPDGTLTQGFLVLRDTAASTLHEEAALSLDGDGADLGTAGGAWTVVIDDAAALALAQERADDLATSFALRFVPVALLALACAAMLVVLVARAERTAQERARFAAAAAHELRTPLAGLQLYGDMLADGLGHPERARDYAQRVSEEAARLGRVVSNVLDFSRLERGNLSVSTRVGDAAASVRAAADRARPSMERAGVELQLDVPETLPAMLDDDALARILGNLLDNAEKYGRGADDRTVIVGAAREGDAVVIRVRDAGPGVAPDAVGGLFRQFTRAAPSDGPPGLGLGLALSRSLARAMGGELEHADSAGGGATFVVTLRAPAGD
jgi:signal transduction histidine kinase